MPERKKSQRLKKGGKACRVLAGKRNGAARTKTITNGALPGNVKRRRKLTAAAGKSEYEEEALPWKR